MFKFTKAPLEVPDANSMMANKVTVATKRMKNMKAAGVNSINLELTNLSIDFFCHLAGSLSNAGSLATLSRLFFGHIIPGLCNVPRSFCCSLPDADSLLAPLQHLHVRWSYPSGWWYYVCIYGRLFHHEQGSNDWKNSQFNVLSIYLDMHQCS